jgi:hypothetical protein
MAKYVGFRQGKVHESHVISEYYCGGVWLASHRP